MNEAESRAEMINPALKAAGWDVVQGICGNRERTYRINLSRLHHVFADGL
jgi:type I site-specific restriction endonuclease